MLELWTKGHMAHRHLAACPNCSSFRKTYATMSTISNSAYGFSWVDISDQRVAELANSTLDVLEAIIRVTD